MATVWTSCSQTISRSPRCRRRDGIAIQLGNGCRAFIAVSANTSARSGSTWPCLRRGRPWGGGTLPLKCIKQRINAAGQPCRCGGLKRTWCRYCFAGVLTAGPLLLPGLPGILLVSGNTVLICPELPPDPAAGPFVLPGCPAIPAPEFGLVGWGDV